MHQKKRNRNCAALAAAGILLNAAFVTFPANAEDTGYIFCDSFEDGASGWIGRGAAKTAVSQKEACAGSGSLYVSGRSAAWNGAAEELHINPESAIVTGVSRWGKAAAVCGAFDTRFKMVAPSCSGAGGIALYRYKSENKTYDFSSKGGSAAYTYDLNEPLSNLQSPGEQGWFNSRFLEFRDPNQLPVDQHMLGALCADPNRYLFIIASCQNENWVNAPSMWMSYLGMRHVWDYLGISDHLAINVHLSGHAVIEEDVKYMCQYFDYHVYGIEPKDDLTKLQTSVFALPKNHDPLWDTFTGKWLY